MVRKIYKPATKGIHRVNWDLRYVSPTPVRLHNDEYNPMKNGSDGMLALPGKYTVTLSLYHDGKEKPLAGPMTFNTKVLNNTTLPAKDRQSLDAFFGEMSAMWRTMSGAQQFLNSLKNKTAYVQQAIQITPGASLALKDKAQAVKEEIEKINYLFHGTPAKASFEEVPPEPMPLMKRLNEAVYASWQSTSAPTEMQKMNLKIVKDAMPDVLARIKKVDEQLKALDKALDAVKAPYTPGRLPE